MRHLIGAIFAIFGGFLTTGIDLFVLMTLAKLNPDRTVGGAYAAMFMLTAPVAFILGAILFGWLFYKWG